jgi:hypothetical protein
VRHFDGHGAFQLFISSQVDFAKTARPKPLLNPVSADPIRHCAVIASRRFPLRWQRVSRLGTLRSVTLLSNFVNRLLPVRDDGLAHIDSVTIRRKFPAVLLDTDRLATSSTKRNLRRNQFAQYRRSQARTGPFQIVLDPRLFSGIELSLEFVAQSVDFGFL